MIKCLINANEKLNTVARCEKGQPRKKFVAYRVCHDIQQCDGLLERSSRTCHWPKSLLPEMAM